MNLISCGSMIHISDIKLIRTDTTLDLSQKAEKGMLYYKYRLCFYSSAWYLASVDLSMWDALGAMRIQLRGDYLNFLH